MKKSSVKFALCFGLLAAVGGCASQAARSGATDMNGQQQRLLTAWNAGSCPSRDDDWRTWVPMTGSANVPNVAAASPGQRTTELPIPVNRFVLCRYDTGSGRRTGAAVVTAPATVARLTADLSSVTATDHTGCPGTQKVAILAGEGKQVVVVDVLIGACDQVVGPQLAVYEGDTLPNDLAAAVSAKS